MIWTVSPRSRKRLLRLACVIVALGWLASCSTVRFYTQAARGQWDILHRARPVPEVLADPQTSTTLQQKLRLIESLRDYARRELHLPADKQFRDYADLQRKYVVWVVFAAPTFSVEAKTWYYPLVGTLKYRGFFNEADAKAEAGRLKEDGYDVHVGGTDAYSTLGWFADPVLNTFLDRNDAELAELVFHELTHSRVFLSGDTDFNEALATAFAQHGARRWLRDHDRLDALQAYEASLAKDREIIALLLITRSELKEAFAREPDKAAAKQQTFARMTQRYQDIRKRWDGDSRYDRYFATPMNNARLNSVATYFDLVPGFERILRQCDGDPESFFLRMESLKPMSQKARRAAVLSEKP